MSIPASYKPSPLSFNSPRSSPFRRPESPASPSPLRNSTTPTRQEAPSPTKTMGTPSKMNLAPSPVKESEQWTPRGLPPAPRDSPRDREPEKSPTRASNRDTGRSTMMAASRNTGGSDALSKLQPAQVRELREGFQILDRDSDGVVNREDVADILAQLGLPSSSSDISPFFPPSQPQTTTLPTFMNSISTLLSALSPTPELLSAFSAFDNDDSGQIDLAELKDALLHTAPDPGDQALTEREVDKIMNGFSGRRAFGKNTDMKKRGEVFKYQEFVNAIAGGSEKDENGRAEG